MMETQARPKAKADGQRACRSPKRKRKLAADSTKTWAGAWQEEVKAPTVGLEPTTTRLRALRSAD